MQTLRESEMAVGWDASCWKIVLRGVVWGAMRALLGTILYMASLFAYVMFTIENAPTAFERTTMGWYELSALVLVWFGATLFVFFIFVLAPSMAGGGVVAWALLALDRGRKLRLGLSVVLGCFIGSVAGLAVVGLIPIIFIPETAEGFIESWPSIVGAAILVGVWHSWRMARWLLRRTQSQSKDQTVSEG
jgi:hypothetical protein